MSASTTMTIRINSDLKQKLGRLAQDTRRSHSFLAAEAVAAYVERELAIIDGVQRGLEDVREGRVVANEAAIAEIYSAIDAVGDAAGADKI